MPAEKEYRIRGHVGAIQLRNVRGKYVGVWIADDKRLPGVRLTHFLDKRDQAVRAANKWFTKVLPHVDDFKNDHQGGLPVALRSKRVVLLPGVEFDEATKDRMWKRAGGRVERGRRVGKASCECTRPGHDWHLGRRKCNRVLAAARHGNRERNDGWEFDHFPVPAAEGGNGDANNGRVTCWECHKGA